MFVLNTTVQPHNKVRHYAAASGGGTLVNSRPCARRYEGVSEAL